MERQYVNSSMIRGIGYNPQLCILEVEFNDGAIWQYNNFPESLWNQFQVAESKGKFFHAYIRKEYTPKGHRVR